jgi:hypothetical protein
MQSGDVITTGLSVTHGSLTTAATTNLGSGAIVSIDTSTLQLGAHLDLSQGDLSLFGPSSLGRGAALNTIDVKSISDFASQPLTLLSGDRVDASLLLSSATVTTAATTNLKPNVFVTLSGQSTLNLGADLDLTKNGTLELGGFSKVDANGHDITASTILLHGNADGSSELVNYGTLQASTLFAFNTSFVNFTPSAPVSLTLKANDTVGDLNVFSLWGQATSLVTTTAVGNITGNVNIANGGELLLRANLNLTGNVGVSAGGILDAAGHDITAGSVVLTDSAQLLRDDLFVGSLSLNNNATMLHVQSDTIGSQISLANLSNLTLAQNLGVSTGLTLNGDTLAIDSTSVLALEFARPTPGEGFDWIFRWANPNAGDRISALNTMISEHEITISRPYELESVNGYTYVVLNPSIATPEPSTFALTIVAAIAGLAAWTQRCRAIV